MEIRTILFVLCGYEIWKINKSCKITFVNSTVSEVLKKCMASSNLEQRRKETISIKKTVELDRAYAEKKHHNHCMRKLEKLFGR